MSAVRRLYDYAKRWKFGIGEILFPAVCLICSNQRTLEASYICPTCLARGFESAHLSGDCNAGDLILPEGVCFQDALWTYRKHGGLQQLLYHLKYDHKAILGEQLGMLVGQWGLNRPLIRRWLDQQPEVCLVPVPLHPSKMRIRGFNQARRVARGLSRIVKRRVVEVDLIKRRRKTVTQTGFSLASRFQNMQNAFDVVRPAAIEGKRHLIVDDIFTTGSTVFELSNCLRKSGSQSIGILTVAQTY